MAKHQIAKFHKHTRVKWFRHGVTWRTRPSMHQVHFLFYLYFQRINLKATKHEIIHDC